MKCKAGALLLNETKHTNCTRCVSDKLESLEHVIWECNANQRCEPTNKLLSDLWKLLPEKLDNENIKPLYWYSNPSHYHTEITKWILKDDSPGIICKLFGNLVEKILKTRPEYDLHKTLEST